MNKEDVVQINSEIFLSHKKEWNSAICSNMNAASNDHTKWSKLEGGRQISYDIIYGTTELISEAETEESRLGGVQGGVD